MTKQEFQDVVCNYYADWRTLKNLRVRQSDLFEGVKQHDPQLASLIEANYATGDAILDYLKDRVEMFS